MNPADWVRDTKQYFEEVQAEYKKITWPPQNEAVAGTISVLVVIALVTTVLGIVDFGLTQFIRLVLQ